MIAAIAAVVLAALGAILLVGYVRGADDRAMAGLETETVLVVTQPIAAGTPAESLEGSTRLEKLPAMAVVPGALTSLDEVAGQVAVTVLVPGEQLIATRFADPASLANAGEVPIPPGLQEVSIKLEPQRVIGGHLAAGDRVGVFVSIGPGQTNLALPQVLVTRVVGAAPAAPAEGEGEGQSTAAVDDVMVSLALSTPEAERLVFASEFGTVWLSLQPEGVDLNGSIIVTPENIYE